MVEKNSYLFFFGVLFLLLFFSSFIAALDFGLTTDAATTFLSSESLDLSELSNRLGNFAF